MEKKIVLATLSLLPLTTMGIDASQVGVVTANSLNVRSGAGLGYAKVFSLSKNEKVTIKSSSNGWYNIINSKNKEGWVSSQYIKISESDTVVSKKVVSVDKLNMRSGPSTSDKVLKVLSRGNEVEVISVSNGWSKITHNGTTGYVSSLYLSNSNNSGNTNNPGNTNDSVTKVTKYVNTSNLNVRSGPSTSYSILGKLQKNEKVEVLSETSTWSKITYSGKTGYVSSQYLSNTSDSGNSNNSGNTNDSVTKVTKYVNTSNLNVRSGPSTSYSILGKLQKNEKVEVLSETSTWSKITYSGKTAYVSSQYLSNTIIGSDNNDNNNSGGTTQTQNKKVTATSLNVRSGPGTSYSVLGTLYKGSVVKALSEKNGWIEISFNSKTGYLSSEYLTNTSESEGIVSGGNTSGSGSGSTSGSSNSYVSLNYSLNQHIEVQYAKALKGGNKIDASLSTATGSGYVNATREDLNKYMNPNNLTGTQKGLNQFLRLDSYKGGVTIAQLNSYLNSLAVDSSGKNVFHNKGEAFINAAKNNNIDLAYFVAHAMVETGYGRSTLAKGQYVGDVMVYNFFGIAAYDGTAVSSGKNYAYKMGWTSVEKTLEGSAKWIASNYIQSSYNQNTLYKMRWNYNYSNHQYATDVNWANLIGSVMTKITPMYSSGALKYEIPKYM